MAIKKIRESIHNMTKEEVTKKCEACIDYLKSKINEMREPNDEDI